MKTYGPFKPEDVASLPQENAKILVKQGVAVEVEAKP
jgi:DNA replication initiation complex subunit (GINS family)